MNFLERLFATGHSSKPKSHGFDDQLTVHTAPSGTQYVSTFDIIIHKDTVSEVNQLRESVRQQDLKQEPTRQNASS